MFLVKAKRSVLYIPTYKATCFTCLHTSSPNIVEFEDLASRSCNITQNLITAHDLEAVGISFLNPSSIYLASSSNWRQGILLVVLVSFQVSSTIVKPDELLKSVEQGCRFDWWAEGCCCCHRKPLNLRELVLQSHLHSWVSFIYIIIHHVWCSGRWFTAEKTARIDDANFKL